MYSFTGNVFSQTGSHLIEDIKNIADTSQEMLKVNESYLISHKVCLGALDADLETFSKALEDHVTVILASVTDLRFLTLTNKKCVLCHLFLPMNPNLHVMCSFTFLHLIRAHQRNLASSSGHSHCMFNFFERHVLVIFHSVCFPLCVYAAKTFVTERIGRETLFELVPYCVILF